MWYALWIKLPGDDFDQWGGWLYLDAQQLNMLHRWIRADPYPCVATVRELGFKEITLVDTSGAVAYHVPACPPGMAS